MLNLSSKDIRASVSDHWEKSGLFVFTSAGSVYAENEGGEVDESSEVAWGERSGKLLDGEETVFDAGGSVLRLGGLYTETRSVEDIISIHGVTSLYFAAGLTTIGVAGELRSSHPSLKVLST